MDHETRWLRKASFQEKLTNGNFLVAYRMSICTRQPLQSDNLRKALSRLYRKCPNLRTCLAKRNDELWFKKMEKEILDFEVTSSDVDDVTDYMHCRSYSPDGPLWCARLIPVPSPRYQPHNLSSFHEDLKITFPHCYHIVFGFNHAIGDGHSFKRICIAFAHILDSVLSEEEVDGEQIGSFELNEEYIRKEKENISMVSDDEKLREKYIHMGEKGSPKSSLIYHVLSLSEGGPRKTALYNQTLDKPTTTRLREKCRAKMVTISSLMAAAGNLALVDLLAENGVIQDTYSISNRHLVNLRRVWPKGTTEETFGSYAGSSLRQYFETPKTVDEELFWEYVNHVQEKFYSILNDEKFFEMVCFNFWCYTNKTECVQCDLTFNTRGDLTKDFEASKEIVVTNLLSSAAIHRSRIPWENVFGTVRGRLTHTVKWNTGMVSKATAVRYSDLVYARLLKAAGPEGNSFDV